jgi:Flp pilus assembly protein TadD
MISFPLEAKFFVRTFSVVILVGIILFPSSICAQEVHKEKAERLNEEGVGLVFKGKRQEGISKIKQAFAHDPHNTAILYNLAGLYIGEGDIYQAKLIMEKALEVDPDDVQFLSRYGEILIASRDFEQAVTVYQKILIAEPKHSGALVKLGAVYGMLERWEEAENSLREARKLRGDDPGLLSNLGNILVVRKKYEEAVSVLEKSQALKPDPDTAVTLGIACEALGEKAKAVNHYKRARELGHKGENLEDHISDLSD